MRKWEKVASDIRAWETNHTAAKQAMRAARDSSLEVVKYKDAKVMPAILAVGYKKVLKFEDDSYVDLRKAPSGLEFIVNMARDVVAAYRQALGGVPLPTSGPFRGELLHKLGNIA